MHDVFISYKVMNRPFAIEYFTRLKEMKLDVWFDQLIPHNEKWAKHIRKNIIDSKFFLCLLSKDIINDKWVLNQLEIARRYNKRIIFLKLDETPIEEFKKYKIKEEVYESFDNINFSELTSPKQKYKDYLYYSELSYTKNNNPFLLVGIISIISILTYFLGINLLNLSVGMEISYLFIGIIGMFFLSLRVDFKIFFINSIISIVLLLIGMYILEPYYITDISIVPLIYMMIYFFTFLIRYSNYKNKILAYLFGLLYSLFLVAFTGSVNIFFIYIFNLDVSWFNIVMMVGFNVYLYFSSHNHLILQKDLKYTNDLIQGLDIVRRVEKKYED